RPLADSGSGVRRAHPGGGPGLGLDPRGWDTLAANVRTAVDLAREAGLEPTFHPHACTYVETPAEIDELLARTDVGLTLDTGHLILGGGDPLTGLRRWAKIGRAACRERVERTVGSETLRNKNKEKLDLWVV